VSVDFLPARFRNPFAWALGSIVLAALLAYANRLSGPFIFDDLGSIPQNSLIGHPGRFMEAYAIPRGETVANRPLLELSLAINYALGGENVRGYHAVNLLIHILAALALFGLARRTFLQPVLQDRYGRDALLLGWAVATLWAVHPMQTQAVTYIVQRAESLASLFYLLTLYCFARAVQSRSSGRWLVLSVACCYLGVGSKEVIMSAPILVLLYDRTFVTGRLGESWRRRKLYYLALAGIWVIVGIVMARAGGRGGTVGIVAGVPWPVYALSEIPVVMHYLSLSVWPHPLVFDYGPVWIRDPWQAAPAAAFLVLLFSVILFALRRAPTPAARWRAIAFPGCWFFLILAPTSTVVPINEGMFEYRAYLALAAVVAGAVLLGHHFLGRRGLGIAMAVVAPLLIAVTLIRNHDYRSAVAIWTDTIAKRPLNRQPHRNLAMALMKLNRLPEAIIQYQALMALDPQDPEIHCNIGVALDQLGRLPEAVEQYREALALDPKSAHAYCNWGVILNQQGHPEEAAQLFKRALELKPAYAEAENNLGVLLDAEGQTPEAIAHFEAAVRIDPHYVEALNNLGDTLGAAGRCTEAIEKYRQALQADPANVSAHYNMAIALTQLGRFPEAEEQYEEVLRLAPDHSGAQTNLARLKAFSETAPGK
jgi:tetratricopeptide (TPR) repeat protein